MSSFASGCCFWYSWAAAIRVESTHTVRVPPSCGAGVKPFWAGAAPPPLAQPAAIVMASAPARTAARFLPLMRCSTSSWHPAGEPGRADRCRMCTKHFEDALGRKSKVSTLVAGFSLAYSVIHENSEAARRQAMGMPIAPSRRPRRRHRCNFQGVPTKIDEMAHRRVKVRAGQLSHTHTVTHNKEVAPPVPYRPGYEVVAEQILRLIAELDLRPGDRMPTENELAARMGTSRTLVREALKILSAIGRVRAHKGRGLYVADDEGMLGSAGWGQFFLPTDLDHVYMLFEYRRIQETAAS